MIQRRRELMAMQSDLPGTYRMVEYIEGTGTQHIETGIYPQDNDALEISFSSLTVGDNLRPLGAYAPGVALDGYNGLRIFTENYSYNFPEYNISNGQITTIRCSQAGEWTINGNLITTNLPIRTQSTVSLCLFKARYINNNLYGKSDMKLYGFKYSKDGGILMDLHPCVRKSDSKPGLYDIVSKHFYTNAGTGEFIVPA